MANPFQKQDAMERNLRKLRRSSSGQYLVFVIVFLVVGAVFLTSSLWIPALLPKEDEIASEIGSAQPISATANLTLRCWDYAADEDKMEVGFDVNVLDDLTDSLTVSAVCIKGETRREVPAELVGCWEQKLFVTLSDIPETYDTITLNLQAETAAGDAAVARFSCGRSVHRVDKIKRRSVTDFRVYAIDLTLQDIKEQDDTYTASIQEAQSQYHALEEDIAALEKQKPYQTASEQKNTEARQAAIQNEQNTLLQSISGDATARRELREKEEVLGRKRAAILSGEF